MGNDCSKYSEKLSAYLDGQLTPSEAAEVAAHLETCKDCSLLLEKMRLLDDLGKESLPEFDQSVLDELESRIEREIDSLPTAAEPSERRKIRIIPIWHRYAAVAASIVFFFMIGRIALKDMDRLLEPRTVQTPAVHTVPVTADKKMAEELAQPPEEEKEGAESKKGRGQLKDTYEIHAPVVDRAAPPSRSVSIPQPVPDAGLKSAEKLDEAEIPVNIAGEDYQSFEEAEIKKAVPIMKPVDKIEKPEADLGTITGRVVDEKTGEPLPGVSVQLEGTAVGAMTDKDGQYKIISIPVDTYRLKFSAVGYESAGVDTVASSGGISKSDIQLKREVSFDGKTLQVVSSVAESGKSRAGEGLIPIGELEDLYRSLIGDETGQMPAKSAAKGGEVRVAQKVMPRAMALLDSLAAARDPESFGELLKRLYIEAGLNRDLYIEYGDETYLNRAVSLRDSMMTVINRYSAPTKGEREILQEYKSTLEGWQIKK